jgi:predicted acyl esterase
VSYDGNTAELAAATGHPALKGDVSPYSLRTQIENSGAAMYVCVSWLDAGTVDGALSRYLIFSNPQKLIIGPWSHGGEHHTDPFLPTDTPTDPPVEPQLHMLVAFFDRHLKDNSEKPPERGSTYYVLGAAARRKAGWRTAARPRSARPGTGRRWSPATGRGYHRKQRYVDQRGYH